MEQKKITLLQRIARLLIVEDRWFRTIVFAYCYFYFFIIKYFIGVVLYVWIVILCTVAFNCVFLICLKSSVIIKDEYIISIKFVTQRDCVMFILIIDQIYHVTLDLSNRHVTH